MHWVWIGDAAAIGGGVVASFYSESVYPLVAVASVVVLLHFLYRHAVARGQGEPRPAGAA